MIEYKIYRYSDMPIVKGIAYSYYDIIKQIDEEGVDVFDEDLFIQLNNGELYSLTQFYMEN
ncbi:MAG: hypothetical protein II393_02205 [Cytophagales bacterium]|nr:hypothetical protein [Cytophagales bacterium]